MALDLIRWLHLSDFHVGTDNFAQQRTFEKILENVEERTKNGLGPHFVFITGDVANKAKPEEYNWFNDRFLTKLKELLKGCEPGEILIVPGNHDVDKNQAKTVLTHGVLKEFPKHFDPDKEGLEVRSGLLPRFEAFAKGDDSRPGANPHWIKTESGALVECRTLEDGRTVGILGLNTAWLATDRDDRNQLSPGFLIAEHGLKQLKECDVRFVLGHHPIGWFLDEERGRFDNLFGRYRVIYVYGHIHKNQHQLECAPIGKYISVQCGTAFLNRERDFPPCFVWAALDSEHDRILVDPLKWDDNYQEWKSDVAAFSNVQKIIGLPPWCCYIPVPRTSPNPRPAQRSTRLQHRLTWTNLLLHRPLTRKYTIFCPKKTSISQDGKHCSRVWKLCFKANRWLRSLLRPRGDAQCFDRRHGSQSQVRSRP